MIFRPIIDNMVWSYSRLKTFEDCPYRFYLKYISECQETERFYSSYGSFIHKLIEEYYRGNLSKEEMLSTFLTGFSENVKGLRPKENIVQNYIKQGIEYLKGFQPFKYPMVDVEKQINFEIDNLKFIGYIDYLGEENGEYYIIDNKSRNLKLRSTRKKPTKNDEELDIMLRQLYLYSAGVKQLYGKFPKALCFNCFKTNTFIEEPFHIEKYDETIEWAKSVIEDIRTTDDFYPNKDFFSCRYICGVSEECVYDQLERSGS